MVGFLLMFFAVTGGLVVLVMPFFEAIEAPILQFVMLPTLVIGVALIIFEKMQTASDY
jgi:hypothetical protein